MTKKKEKPSDAGVLATKGRYSFFINLCIKGTEDLRSLLKISDDQYRQQHYSTAANPKDYYLYGALNELEKVGTSLMRFEELIAGGDVGVLEDRLGHNMFAAVLDEQLLWVRKLTELLTELILFAETNERGYYQHYMLAKGLRNLTETIKNLQHAYGSAVQNYLKQAAEISAKISEFETNGEVDVGRCWYLRRDRRSPRGRLSATETKFSALNERLNEALSKASQAQLIALGLSVNEGYGTYSIAIHFNPVHTRPERHSLAETEKNMGHIGILAGHVIAQIRNILDDHRPDGYAAFVAEGMGDDKEIAKLIEQRIKPEIETGDFVNAQGELGQVTDIHTGAYGYRSFRIKFMLPEVTEAVGSGKSKTVWKHPNPEFEEYPAMWVAKIFSRRQILEQMQKTILAQNPNADVREENLNPMIDSSMINFWNEVGLKELVQGRPRHAVKKMEQKLKGSR